MQTSLKHKANRHNAKRAAALILINSLLIMALAACFEKNGENSGTVTKVLNGKAYYNEHCAICHAAGAEDKTSAFDATNLVNPLSIDNITEDMSAFGRIDNSGIGLMGQFNNIKRQDVVNLRSYLRNSL